MNQNFFNIPMDFDEDRLFIMSDNPSYDTKLAVSIDYISLECEIPSNIPYQ